LKSALEGDEVLTKFLLKGKERTKMKENRAARTWSAVVSSGLQAAVQLIPDRTQQFVSSIGDAAEGIILRDQLKKVRAFLGDLNILLACEMEWTTFCEGVLGLLWCSMFIVNQMNALIKNPPKDDADDQDNWREFLELSNNYLHLNELLTGCLDMAHEV
jgi:hypothetical protein